MTMKKSFTGMVSFLCETTALLALGTSLVCAATTSIAKTPTPLLVAPAAATTIATAPKPPEPPPSVPDKVNPFADDKNPPVPLQFPGAARPRLSVDVHSINFDGMDMMEMYVKGPDFNWQLDPLADFVPAPTNFVESTAFVYQPNPGTRLSWSLYGFTELLPSFTADAVEQYLAAVRATDPKNFILLTPIPKDAKFIQPDAICGFQAQSVEYAIVSPTSVIVYQDWFLDLHDEYILLVSLSGPQALVDKLTPTIHYFLARSRIIDGLGVKAEDTSPKPAPPASTTPSDG